MDSSSETLLALGQMFRPGHVVDSEDEGDSALTEEQEFELLLDPELYRVADMLDDAFADLDQMNALLVRCREVGLDGDHKYEQLRGLLLGGMKSQSRAGELFDPAFTKHKVLVFTEFADTARYIHERLVRDGLTEVDRLDGSRKSNRVEMIRRFAPYYNGLDASQRKQLKPLRVLISTDVLSEGVNLQDSTQIINFDIHWNPVRLMQRIGRVDRRLNPVVEAAIIADAPSVKKIRGRIAVRNFLPNDELNAILSLYSRVQSRVLLISKTLGIPGGKLLDADDMLDDTKVFEAFLSEYMGDLSPAEELRLKLLTMIEANPGLADQLDQLPPGAHAAKDGSPAGLFTCTVEPLRQQDGDAGAVTWTRDPGRPRWALQKPDGDVVTDLLSIDSAIACEPSTPGRHHSDPNQIRARLSEMAEIRRTELLKDNMPLDAPTTRTACWMEIRG